MMSLFFPRSLVPFFFRLLLYFFSLHHIVLCLPLLYLFLHIHNTYISLSYTPDDDVFSAGRESLQKKFYF